MNTARAIYTNESYRKPELNTKVLLSDNFIERMKRLDHAGLATLLQNAGITQQKVMPNIPVPILVESISRNNFSILSKIKNYLNTRNSSKYRMLCLPINSSQEKAFFYTTDSEGKILKEIGGQFIPEYIRSYINGIKSESIISAIESLYTANILILNSLSSTSEQASKASFIIQLIETVVEKKPSKNPREGYVVIGNFAVKDEAKARVLNLLDIKSRTVGILGKANMPVLTSSGAYGKGTGKAGEKSPKVYRVKFRGE